MPHVLKRILVAEDNPALQSVIRFNLERCGYEVTVASDGYEAWNTLQQGGFDLLITDHQMPQMTGVELLERIRRADPQQAQLPVFLLTAKSLELERQRLQMELGVAEVFSKPFSPVALLQAVEQHLGAMVT